MTGAVGASAATATVGMKMKKPEVQTRASGPTIATGQAEPLSPGALVLPSPLDPEFGARLNQERNARGLTFAQLAVVASSSPGHLCSITKGTLCTAELAGRLLTALEATPSESRPQQLSLKGAASRFCVDWRALKEAADGARVRARVVRRGDRSFYFFDENELAGDIAALPRCKRPGCDAPAFRATGACPAHGASVALAKGAPPQPRQCAAGDRCLHRDAAGQPRLFTPRHPSDADQRFCAQECSSAAGPSDETRAKMSAVHQGKTLTPEWKARIAASKVGDRNPSRRPEVREKIAASLLGYKHSQATRAKLRQERTQRWRERPESFPQSGREVARMKDWMKARFAETNATAFSKWCGRHSSDLAAVRGNRLGRPVPKSQSDLVKKQALELRRIQPSISNDNLVDALIVVFKGKNAVKFADGKRRPKRDVTYRSARNWVVRRLEAYT